jgi:hypothetical protein
MAGAATPVRVLAAEFSGVDVRKRGTSIRRRYDDPVIASAPPSARGHAR